VSSPGSGRSSAGAVGRRVVLAVAIAVSVVVIGGWTGRTGARPVEVTVLRGTVNTVNLTGTAIGFRGKRVGGPRLRMVDVDGGWVVAGATWFDRQGWHDHGTPPCRSSMAFPHRRR
jgi:hypothetical protein